MVLCTNAQLFALPIDLILKRRGFLGFYFVFSPILHRTIEPYMFLIQIKAAT